MKIITVTEVDDKVVEKWSIKMKINNGVLPNPYELQESDEGKQLDMWDFGKVAKSDIGKLVYLKDDIIQMENNEQMNKRKEKESIHETFNCKTLKYVLEVTVDKDKDEEELQQQLTEIINDAGITAIVFNFEKYANHAIMGE